MLLSTLYLPAAPKLLYDGCEADWGSQPWLLPPAAGAPFPVRLSPDVHPIGEVAAWLGNTNFRQLLLDVRATVRDWSGHGDFAYRGGATACRCTTCARAATCGCWPPASGSPAATKPFCTASGS